jgi:hypothetical protein
MVKTEFVPTFRTTDMDRHFAGYNLDYIQLSHLLGGKYGRRSTIKVVVFAIFNLSTEHDTDTDLSTAAVRRVQHSGCTHPGNLPLTVLQSSVAVPSHHEGPGSKRTPDYCHQPEPSQGYLVFNSFLYELSTK